MINFEYKILKRKIQKKISFFFSLHFNVFFYLKD